jgi:hypothetical protein
VLDGDASLPATVMGLEDGSLRARFDDLTLQEDEALTMVLYSRADSWLGWGESRDRDHPLRSLARLLRLALRGLRQAIVPPRSRPRRGRLATSIVPLLAIAFLLPGLFGMRQGAAAAQAQSDEAKQSGGVKPNDEIKLPSQLMSTSVGKPNPRSPSAWLEGVSRPPGGHAAAERHDKQAEPRPVEVTANANKEPTGSLLQSQESKLQVAGATPKAADSKLPVAEPSSVAAPTVQATAVQATVAMPRASAAVVAPDSKAAASDWRAMNGVHPLAQALAVLPDAPSEPVADPPALASKHDSGAANAALAVQSGWRMQLKSAADAVSHGQLLVVWVLASLLAAQYPWALLLMVVLQSFLTAILLRAMLRRRARERLLGHI